MVHASLSDRIRIGGVLPAMSGDIFDVVCNFSVISVWVSIKQRTPRLTVTATKGFRYFRIQSCEERGETFFNGCNLFSEDVDYVQETRMYPETRKEFSEELFRDQKLAPGIALMQLAKSKISQ